MNINDAFPSQYVKAADLAGKQVTVVMSEVTMAELGDERKPVVFFVDKEKGLVLNKTNALEIASAYGDDTEKWAGNLILMYPAKTLFQGRQVDCIRVSTAVPHATPDPQEQSDPPPPQDESDLPF